MSKKKKKSIWRTIRNLIWLLVLLTLVLIGVVLYARYGKDVMDMQQEARLLVKLSEASDFHTTETSIVYDASGAELKSLSGEKDLYYVSYDKIPKHFVNAMVAVEDRAFFEHKGIDEKGIMRAFVALIEHDGEITQGGSTITQQLAKNMYLTNEVTWRRKVKEAFLAVYLEEKYSKEQILEFYLNNIYFANGYYGIDAAAKGYFQKELKELSLSQIAFLCAIPNSPNYYNPVDNMENTLERRDKILGDMLEEGYITELAYAQALEEQIALNMKKEAHNNYVETYIYYEATRALMKAKGFDFQYQFASDYEQEQYNEKYNALYTECQQSLYTGGFRIYTSMDLKIQKQLQKAVDEGLADNTEKNDEGIFAFQGAAACFDNETGYICAIVGGRSQNNIEGYTLNRGYQSPRQPGSAMKPLNVYLPAFHSGYNPNNVEKVYYKDGKLKKEMNLWTAIARSDNDVANQIYEALTPLQCMNYIMKMEFKYLTAADYEIQAGALGGFTYGVTVEEMAGAYAAIENDGKYIAPTCIMRITDAEGENIYVHNNKPKQVYESYATSMMIATMERVLQKGGTAAGYGLEDMHCAGKTGTTNRNYDGWFCGFTPYYTTAVWVGYDLPREFEELKGNTYPAQIWQSFMTWMHRKLEDVPFAGGYDLEEHATEASSEETEEASKTEAASDSETESSETEAPGEETTDTEASSEETEEETTEEKTTEETTEEEEETTEEVTFEDE